LFDAGERATAAGARDQYESMLTAAASTDPSLELYTALINVYSENGQIDLASQAADKAIALIPDGDTAALQKYRDFRTGLLSLLTEMNAVKANPSDPEAHRALAKAWLARGQANFALPEYQQVVTLLPNDYDAHRMVALLLVQRDQLTDARGAITVTLTLAPEKERPFWQQLGAVLDSAREGQNATAVAALDALLKSVDPQDNVTVQALRELSSKLKGSG